MMMRKGFAVQILSIALWTVFWIFQTPSFSASTPTEETAKLPINKSHHQESNTGSVSAFDIAPTVVKAGNNNATNSLCDSFQFAVSGFAKCGTSTMTYWLHNHPEIAMPKRELHWMRGRPEKVASVIEEHAKQKQKQQQTSIQSSPSGVRLHSPRTTLTKGYRYPHDIQFPRVLDFYRTTCPTTKHIVLLRHPLLWFESLYNYRILGGESWAIRHDDPNALHGSICDWDPAMVCLEHSAFHRHLAKLAKTDMTDPHELDLLSWFGKNNDFVQDDDVTRRNRFDNPILLVEMSQLKASEPDHYKQQLAHDLKEYLGLETPLDPLPPSRNSATQLQEQILPEQSRSRQQKQTIDICSADFSEVHSKLMQVSRNASQWIRGYFAQTPQVCTSSPEHFDHLISEWMKDPCQERRSNHSNNTSVQ
jgi:hypothetical protein